MTANEARAGGAPMTLPGSAQAEGQSAMAKRNQVAPELREIAATLQAMVEGGAFDLCFTDTRADMATLPDKLAALADELED